AVAPCLGAVLAVEKDDLLGIGNARPVTVRLQLEARQGDRMEHPRMIEIIGVDEPLAGLDQVEARVEARHQPALSEMAFEQLVPADAKVHRSFPQRPLLRRPGEPLRLDRRIGPRLEYPLGRGGPFALQRKRTVEKGRRGHRCSPPSAVPPAPAIFWNSLFSSSFPSRSNRCSQSWRRSLSQCSTRMIVSAEMRHSRVRPRFSVAISPLASSTWTCWWIAASDVSNGLANSLTDAG